MIRKVFFTFPERKNYLGEDRSILIGLGSFDRSYIKSGITGKMDPQNRCRSWCCL